MTDAVKRAVDILNRKLLNGTLSDADEMETIIRTEIERDNRTPPAGWKLVPVEPKRHNWSRDGETCLDCGDKDWMAGAVCRPTPR